MKKILFKVVIVAIAFTILWSSIFVIDYSRCNNLKMPIFVVSKETADDGGSGIYYGLGYKVRVKKYISANYGAQIESMEMYFVNKVIIASITDRIVE